MLRLHSDASPEPGRTAPVIGCAILAQLQRIDLRTSGRTHLNAWPLAISTKPSAVECPVLQILSKGAAAAASCLSNCSSLPSTDPGADVTCGWQTGAQACGFVQKLHGTA